MKSFSVKYKKKVSGKLEIENYIQLNRGPEAENLLNVEWPEITDGFMEDSCLRNHVKLLAKASYKEQLWDQMRSSPRIFLDWAGKKSMSTIIREHKRR